MGLEYSLHAIFDEETIIRRTQSYPGHDKYHGHGNYQMVKVMLAVQNTPAAAEGLRPS